ncbi:hypothetical protein PANT_12c00001 [Moesziomyces antarcticus T-34]|uniref:Uncharacterized protein n=1 Tax=Pseudozyma antarctica (strain T-34) TaxID=1151754 RepID=M9MFP6_PSEA3|nr:hypothetical protein PANT_12c00001 [Moesziomyces antarcticus T-34]
MSDSKDTVHLDVQLLNRSTDAEVLSYLRDQQFRHTEPAITRALVRLITIEAISPCLSRIWLGIARDPATLCSALEQDHSLTLRYEGIRRFASVLRSKQWRPTWDALGSSQGIAQLLSQFSAKHVSLFTKAIAYNVRGLDDHHKAQKREAVTELLLCLVPSLNPPSSVRDDRLASDSRDLLDAYATLVSACTPQMVARVLFDTDHILTLRGNQGHLLREHHRVFFQRSITSDVFKSNWIDQKWELVSLVRAIAMPMAACQDVDLLSAFFLQALDMSKQMPSEWTHPERSRMRRKPYYHPDSLLDILAGFVSQRRLTSHARCAAFQTVINAVLWQPQNLRTSAREALVKPATRAWANSPELFEGVFSQLLGIMPRPSPSHTLVQLSKDIPSHKRWDLLKLLYASNPDNPIDIDQDAQLEKLCTFDANPRRWSKNMFEALPRQQALDLLARLAKYLPRHAIISIGGVRARSILENVVNADGFHDYDMMRFELDENTDATKRFEHATAAVQDCKSKAASSPNPTDRERLARWSISWATCSRSLELYKSTVIWLRRFVRDVTVMRSLFDEANFCTKEAVSLLSGISYQSGSSLTTKDVRHRIAKANEALWEAFENVRAAVLEPSFRARDFRRCTSLMREVVIERMRRIELLQARLGVSVEEVSAIVWDDTVDLLIRVEATCIDPAYRRLELCTILGPLVLGVDDYLLSSRDVCIRSKSGLSFVEKLYAARNTLWESHRTAFEPSVMDLPLGLPRGLPLHAAPGIWNLRLVLPQATDSALLKRAHSIVFAEPQIVMQKLPSDSKTLEVIGECHEDWPYALLLLLMAQSSGQERVELVGKAWLHATQKLTDAALTRSEAESLWRSEVFNSATLGDHYSDFEAFAAQTETQKEELLQLPSASATASTFQAWQPHIPANPTMRRSIFPSPTILDTMIGQDVTQRLWKGSLCPQPVAFGERSWKENDWQARWTGIFKNMKANSTSTIPQHSPTQSARSVFEAQIALDLLLLDKKCPGNNTIDLPFPSRSKQRYPSLALSEEPSTASQAQYELDPATRKRLKTAPPTLLRRLAEKAYAARADGRLPKTSHLPIDLVLCLQASDRPVEAVPLVLTTVLESPEESSWHRILFSRGLLQKLCARDARHAVKTLAERILARTGLPGHRIDSFSNRGCVKVSTIKLLAQVVSDARYVSKSDAINVLTELLKRSTHADIRHTALDAMLRLICTAGSPSDTCSAQLTDSLACLVPILGALDERRPGESVPSWASGAVPTIYDSSPSNTTCLASMRRIPRSCQLVVRALETYPEWTPLLVSAVIIPVIEKSIELNRRWLDLYLEGHGTSNEELKLPVPPVKIDLLKTIVTRYVHLTPNWMVQLYCRYLQTVMRLPARVQEINGRLERTIENAGKHWLSMYEPVDTWEIGRLPFLAAMVYSLIDQAADVDDIARTLSSRTASFDAAGQVLLDAADLVSDLEHGAPDSFKEILSPLASPFSEGGPRSRAKVLAWEAYLRPVLKQTLGRLEALRTPEWERNPHRRPRWLPDPFDYQMWLLPTLPTETRTTEDGVVAAQCQQFGRMLIELMENLVSQGVPCDVKMNKLKTAATSCSGRHKAFLALTLGDFEGERSSDPRTQLMVQCHRVDLAATLIFKAELPPDSEAWLLKIKRMVEGWYQSDVEWIRDRLHKLVTKPDGLFYAFQDDRISSVVHGVTGTEQPFGLFD